MPTILSDVLSVLKRTEPDVGSINRRMHLIVVDFPQPDLPTRPMVEPLFMSKEELAAAKTVWPSSLE
jgi:hypothetical protein